MFFDNNFDSNWLNILWQLSVNAFSCSCNMRKRDIHIHIWEAGKSISKLLLTDESILMQFVWKPSTLCSWSLSIYIQKQACLNHYCAKVILGNLNPNNSSRNSVYTTAIAQNWRGNERDRENWKNWDQINALSGNTALQMFGKITLNAKPNSPKTRACDAICIVYISTELTEVALKF